MKTKNQPVLQNGQGFRFVKPSPSGSPQVIHQIGQDENKEPTRFAKRARVQICAAIPLGITAGNPNKSAIQIKKCLIKKRDIL